MTIEATEKNLQESKFKGIDRTLLDFKYQFAQILEKADQVKEAIPMLEGVYQGRKVIFGEDHRDTWRVLDTKSICLYRKGDFNQSLVLQDEFLKSRLKIYSTNPENVPIACSYHQMGWVIRKKGKCNEALDYFHKSLSIRKKVLGEEHAEVASTFYNIGEAYRTIENFKEAG